MKIKTSELIGDALDWVVTEVAYEYGAIIEDGFVYIRTASGNRSTRSSPSTDWSQGGPILDREHISTKHELPGGHWSAYICFQPPRVWGSGPTLLIAAMRCFVASKLGDEVEIPEELV